MNEEKFSVLTQLYMLLRRNGGRKIDVVWALENQEYALEVLRIARASEDDVVRKLGARFQALAFGTHVPAPETPVPEPTPSSESDAVTERQYVDTLR
jgi:hypothetical protein